MRKLSKLVSVIALSSAASMANAALIDFDSFSDGQNLHGVNLGGVTLTGNSGLVEVFGDNRFGASYSSPLNSISTLGDFILTGVFDSAVNFVSIWGGDDGGDLDSWELEAFDSVVGGNSLGLAQQGDWEGDPYTNLNISASNILRFEARWTGNTAGMAWDDLEFSSVANVSEPGTLALMGLGLFGLAFRSKKKA